MVCTSDSRRACYSLPVLGTSRFVAKTTSPSASLTIAVAVAWSVTRWPLMLVTSSRSRSFPDACGEGGGRASEQGGWLGCRVEARCQLRGRRRGFEAAEGRRHGRRGWLGKVGRGGKNGPGVPREVSFGNSYGLGVPEELLFSNSLG